jgi:uncharacterized membrane protein
VLSTTTLSLPSDGYGEVQLQVLVPPVAQGGAQDTVVIQAVGSGGGAEATVITTAATEYDVQVRSLTDDRIGLPGETVSYTLRVTNTGNTTDTISLVRIAPGWSTSVPSEGLILAADSWQDVLIWVTVPITAPAGLQDLALIRASGSGGYAEESLTTTTAAVYALSLTPFSASSVGLPGEMVVYTLVLSNTGNIGDLFTLSREAPGWPTEISPVLTTLERGGWQTVSVTVTVPTTATSGMSETAVILASGSGDLGETRLSTACVWHQLFLPLLLMDSQ